MNNVFITASSSTFVVTVKEEEDFVGTVVVVTTLKSILEKCVSKVLGKINRKFVTSMTLVVHLKKNLFYLSSVWERMFLIRKHNYRI